MQVARYERLAYLIMQAKVTNYPSGAIQACNGVEFVKHEWRNVPAGFEAEIERHPFLTARVDKPIESDPVKPKRARRTRQPKVTD